MYVSVFYVKCWMEPDLQFIKATSLATLMGTGGARCWLRSWGQPNYSTVWVSGCNPVKTEGILNGALFSACDLA